MPRSSERGYFRQPHGRNAWVPYRFGYGGQIPYDNVNIRINVHIRLYRLGMHMIYDRDCVICGGTALYQRLYIRCINESNRRYEGIA